MDPSPQPDEQVHASPAFKRGLRRISDQLTQLAAGSQLPGNLDFRAASVVGSSQSQYALMAKLAYSDRRRRDAIFGSAVPFSEPAWDILLDLYIAYAAMQQVSVSSACIGSAVPATTGLRWLGVLEEAGLLQRKQDPDDRRCVLVELTQKGVAQMDLYFSHLGGAST